VTRELGLRRVSWVRVVVHGGVTTAEVFGIGHRLPITRRVPVATALGLAAGGVPLVVHTDRPVTPPRPAWATR
jgi:coproporphyrinogen III oxidase